MKVATGTLLMMVGGLHQAVGAVLAREPLGQMLQAGVLDSVQEETGPRATAFWFLAMGFTLLLLGWLCRWVEVTVRRPLPSSLGWGLLALSAFCILPMPQTGAWLVVPLGLRVLWAARRPVALPGVLLPFAADASHVDVKEVTSEASLREFIARLMGYQPAWMTGLYRVRGVLVRLLGMRQEAVPRPAALQPGDVPMSAGAPASFFTVRHAEEERCWVAGVEEQHLAAHLAVTVEPAAPGAGARRRFLVVTIVHYRSWAGPLCFNLIRPFHHLVVGRMAGHAAGRA